MDHCTAPLCLKLSTWVTGDFKEYNLELRNKNSSQSRLDVGQPIWENTMLELEDKSNPVKRSSGWASGFSPRKLLIKVMEGNLHTNNFYSKQMFFHQNKKSKIRVNQNHSKCKDSSYLTFYFKSFYLYLFSSLLSFHVKCWVIKYMYTNQCLDINLLEIINTDVE